MGWLASRWVYACMLCCCGCVWRDKVSVSVASSMLLEGEGVRRDGLTDLVVWSSNTQNNGQPRGEGFGAGH